MHQQMFNAIESGHSKIIRNLISQGANVNAKDSTGITLLHKAIIKDNLDVVKLLIESGANVNLKTKNGQTAMHFALNCKGSTVNCKIIKLLVKHEADMNTMVSEDYIRIKFYNGECEVTEINGRSETIGFTALHAAALWGDVDLLQLLISRGANVNSHADEGQPLHYAVKNIRSEDPSIIEMLLLAGANVNDESREGKTPLHLLCESKLKVPVSLVKIFQVFKKHGANFNKKINCGDTLLKIAINFNNSAVVDSLISIAGFDPNSIFIIHDENEYSRVLHQACARGHLPTVKVLLKNGANINALARNMTPWFYAFYLDDSALINYLFKWNPNVHIKTNEGKNAVTSLSDINFDPEKMEASAKYLAKLQAMGNTIDADVVTSISTLSEFDKCNLELEKAKKIILHHEYRITYFDLLVDDKKKLIQYARNDDLVNNFSKRTIKKLKLYGSEIEERFTKAIEKRKIRRQAEIKLSSFFPKIIDPEHDVINNILEYLSSKDIKNLSSLL